MRYFRTAAFKRAYQSLTSERQERVARAILQLETLFAVRERPFGLGLKALKRGVWEIRAGLEDRILFRWKGDLVEFLFVGSHDEIKRFLKSSS